MAGVNGPMATDFGLPLQLNSSLVRKYKEQLFGINGFYSAISYI